MSTAEMAGFLNRPIIYPETDGRPMAETDVHRREMSSLIDALTDYFRDVPDIYVAGNLLLYYEEGDPTARVAPDVFVVKGVPRGLRRVYKLWEEGRSPEMVIEVSSRSTRLEDLGQKRALYAMLGVGEYFLFDPLDEYLHPPLQGYRLVDGEYQHIPPGEDGALVSETLGLRLTREGTVLRLSDPVTGAPILTSTEVREKARVETERARTEAEARLQVEQRLAEAENELARLRAALAANPGADRG